MVFAFKMKMPPLYPLFIPILTITVLRSQNSFDLYWKKHSKLVSKKAIIPASTILLPPVVPSAQYLKIMEGLV